MFQVGPGDSSILGQSNNTLSANYSYGSLGGLNNGPLSLHYTKGTISLWHNININILYSKKLITSGGLERITPLKSPQNYEDCFATFI